MQKIDDFAGTPENAPAQMQIFAIFAGAGLAGKVWKEMGRFELPPGDKKERGRAG